MTAGQVQKYNRGGEVGFPDEMPTRLETLRPPVQVGSLILWLVLAGVGLFGGVGTWAAFAPIQSAVVARGSFEVEGDLQVVQHLEGGIVRRIEVREGDMVRAGQVIAVLDGTRARSQIGLLYNQLSGALAREARLKAEYSGADKIDFPPELLDILGRYPLFAEVLQVQSDLFNSNRRTDAGRIAILTDRIDQLNERLAGIKERQSAQVEQLDMVSAEVRDLQSLLEKGLTTRSRVVARRQNQAALIGDIGQSESAIQTIFQQVAEIRERVLQVRRDRNLEISDELQLLKEQIFDIRQRLETANDIARRLTIRAPISGRIVGFELNTVGSVIQPGQTLLRIVPEESAYIVEARVSPSDIDEVTLGGPARVRLSSYSYRTTPPVAGTVSYISADSFFDPASNQSYYRVRIDIPDQALAALPNVQAIPGMPVQVMIATGEQTVMTYLLNPILGSLETALVEGE